MAQHKLVTAALMKKTPALYSTENLSEEETIVRFKLFTPWSNWTWYIIEADFETGIAFGLVEGHETELGQFSLTQIAALRGPWGMKAERDLHWQPRTLAALQAGNRY